MNSSAESILLETEFKLRFLKKSIECDADLSSSSDTTVSTTPLERCERAHKQKTLFPIDVCREYFHSVFYERVTSDVFPHAILASDAKRRLISDSAYSAFCVLVSVEGMPADVELCTLFALIVWLPELALAVFYDAKERKDVHEGHKSSLWNVVEHVAYSKKRFNGAVEIQKSARALLRSLESRNSDAKKIESALFLSAQRVTSASISVPFVLSAGCKCGSLLFPQEKPTRR